jgi:hypothetical protein
VLFTLLYYNADNYYCIWNRGEKKDACTTLIIKPEKKDHLKHLSIDVRVILIFSVHALHITATCIWCNLLSVTFLDINAIPKLKQWP